MKNTKNKEIKQDKNTKLSNLEQIHGATEQKLSSNTRLDVLLGADGMGKYGTLDHTQYKNRIEGFSVSDLRNHAITVGFIPISDVNRLKKTLLTEFDKYVLQFTAPTRYVSHKLSPEKQAAALEILSAVK